ncbi:MAG: MBL fold metallo-hydrolase [Treponema porcinum]|nr:MULTISPECIES: MBL fold metallo-hydrolase [Treponema]MCI5644437.1 MBL fold metallo-hydrolase [Treponema porcinum]MCI6482317.1 MBL fold metallo-hydrolase [Treponema porcinum]MCI6815807.1 MBL fold metallo-hydrolase [Treponema porcinum]MDD7126624.1 MBL fold metallo-hydrolase [Treponema porcinum]MDY4468742.1 MBL fold metallo-hydrolase [Treponema porcinum]
MMITMYSLGAAEEVTGSKHILEIDGHQIMIDCGAFQGKRQLSDTKNRDFDIAADKLDAVVLTHGHYDHCGLLPVLTKKGFTGNIYATPATRDIANLVMMDSARIQARDAEFLAKQANKKGEKFTWRPLFNEDDVVKTANQIISLSYNRKMYIAPNVSLEFYDAGHILGSGFAYLTITNGSEETRVLFTGDIGRKEKPIIRNPAVNMPPPDYIVLESTYGNRKHEDAEFAMKELERVVRDTCSKKGKIIIPSFAIERAQELVFYLHLLTDRKKIPVVPIYVDSPMAANATSVFRVHPECYDESVNEAFLKHHKNPFGFGSLSFTTSVEESKSLNDKEGPMIIISADGMCEAGRVLYHLANEIGNERNTILIVGYMAENTLGRKIRDGEKEVKILGDMYHVNAKVEQINAFSAHADYTEMTDWLKTIDTSRLKNIFLVHGEKEAQEFFTDYLHQNGFPNVTTVKYDETYDLK